MPYPQEVTNNGAFHAPWQASGSDDLEHMYHSVPAASQGCLWRASASWVEP